MRTKHTLAHDPQPRHRVNRLLMRARTGGGQRINAVGAHFRYRNYLGFLYIAEVSFLYMWISYIAGEFILYTLISWFFIPYFSILRGDFSYFCCTLTQQIWYLIFILLHDVSKIPRKIQMSRYTFWFCLLFCCILDFLAIFFLYCRTKFVK